MSNVTWKWKNYLKLVILAGGLMMVLMMTPTSHASSPSKTFEGTFISQSTLAGIEQKGNGLTVFSLNGKIEFVPGDITGTLEGPATVVKVSSGKFRIETTGIFNGSIDGRSGSAKYVATAHGVDSAGFCCYTGPFTFYDGTGGLEGLTASGTLTNDLVNGNGYSFDVIFR